MARLQVELLLTLLAHPAQVGAEGGFCDRLGVVVVVLLTLHEGLHIDRWNDARLVAEHAQGSADEMGAEARFHADDTRWLLLERLDQRQSLDLRRNAILPSVPKPTRWKTSLPISTPIEARGATVVSMGCFSG